MFELITSIDINAPSSKVWEILADTAQYESWNPTVRSIRGKLAAGEKITIGISIFSPMGTALPIVARISYCTPNQGITWRGGAPIPGILTGEHYLKLESISPNQTRLVHGEKFEGLVIPLIRGILNTTLRGQYDAMNLALKKRAES